MSQDVKDILLETQCYRKKILNLYYNANDLSAERMQPNVHVIPFGVNPLNVSSDQDKQIIMCCNGLHGDTILSEGCIYANPTEAYCLKKTI